MRFFCRSSDCVLRQTIHNLVVWREDIHITVFFDFCESEFIDELFKTVDGMDGVEVCHDVMS